MYYMSSLRDSLLSTLNNCYIFIFLDILYNYDYLGDLRRTYFKECIGFTIRVSNAKTAIDNELACTPSRSQLKHLPHSPNGKIRI
jgi:hypothetical protein